MIHRTATTWQTPSWRQQLADAFTSTGELLRYLEIDPSSLETICETKSPFGLRVPRGFAARMEKRNPRDPLLLQVLPAAAEGITQAGFSVDPVGDKIAEKQPGILHKYTGRVLIIMTGTCGIHCRYCFRRHYSYTGSRLLREQWQPILNYLTATKDVKEVILSGGDPLVLTDSRLSELTRVLEKLAHIKRLRVHSRLPVVLPERVTNELIAWLSSCRLQTTLVLHINHAREISDDLYRKMHRLRDAGITLLNQSVLLKGVNDSTDTLCDLSERLFAGGVLPYYLHLLDRVQGAAHFLVPDPLALELHRELRDRLPGYLVPRLARDEPGSTSKTLVW